MFIFFSIVAALTLAAITIVLLRVARENTVSLILDFDGRSVPAMIDPGGPDLLEVDRALGLAIRALRMVWPRSVILDVLVQSRIHVKDLGGRSSQRSLNVGMIVVGSDLKTLALEIARAVERRHKGGDPKGIMIANDAYLRDLAWMRS